MPKVIDFGIAKATNQKLTERDAVHPARHHDRHAGLLCMSPEQAELRAWTWTPAATSIRSASCFTNC